LIEGVQSQEVWMKRNLMFALLAAVTLGAPLVMAASPPVAEAIKTLQTVGNDPARLKLYCDIQQAAEALGDKEDAAAEEKIDQMTKQLGPDFEKAFAVMEELDENSADAKEFYEAFDQLDTKCTKS
jgi:hypothetical protein